MNRYEKLLLLFSDMFNTHLFKFLDGKLVVMPIHVDFYRYIYYIGAEQTADTTLFVPNEYIYSIWSQLHIPVFLSYFIIFILWSPLIFSGFILIMYLRNLIKNLNFAHIFTFEQNEIFFPVRDLDGWIAFYRTNFLYFFKGVYTHGYTLPNPLHLHKKISMFRYFIWSPKPLVFRFFMYLLFFYFLFLVDELTISFYLILSLFFTNFILYKFF